MNNEIDWESKASNILDVLVDQIGAGVEGLGKGVEYYYPLFVKQQMIEGGVSLTVVAILILLNIFIVRFVVRKTREEEDFAYDHFPILVVAMIFPLISLVAVVDLGIPAVTQLLNPEYHALKEIMEMIK